MTPELSVVLPCYNERETLEALVARLLPTLEALAGDAFEVIFVDDASDDGSSEMLDGLHERDGRIKVLHLSRNFGHQAALSGGLDYSRGRAVILMDCDLQDPPEVLHDFVREWRNGFEVVYGIRRRRKEGLLKRSAYHVFYRSMRAVAQIDVPLDAGDFCLLDRRVVDQLVRMPELHRFLRGLRSWVGFRQKGVEYARDGRYAGEPKYTPTRLVQLALSGYVGFSLLPLRAAVGVGFVASLGGLLLGVWTIATRLLAIPAPRGWASTLAGIFFLGGVQLLILGVIGEYLGRVYDEVRRRPGYIVARGVGFGAGDAPPAKD